MLSVGSKPRNLRAKWCGRRRGAWRLDAAVADLSVCACVRRVCVQNASELRAVNGQVGTLVMDRAGRVQSSTGELLGAAGDAAGEIIYSMLQVGDALVCVVNAAL